MSEYRISREDEYALERELHRRSLVDYAGDAFNVLEPHRTYVHGWHLDALSEHLAATTTGEITRLILNVPPGMMKSLTAAVVFPTWVWGPLDRPHARFLAASHSQDYAERDNVKARNLVASDWYRARYPRVEIDPKNDAKAKFSTTASGFRQAAPIGSLTGGRADYVVLDDPHTTEGAESDADRERVLRIVSESVPTRLEDPERSVIILIMQRLHERDATGFIVENELGWEHLVLPMRYEPDHPLQRPTSLGRYDRRTEPGELLFPERFPEEAVRRDEDILRSWGGDFAVAGQFQQRPEPRGGGTVPVDAIRERLDAAPPRLNRIKSLVRAWDLASTKDAGAYTVGLLMARLVDDTYVVIDVVRDRLNATERDELIRSTADDDYERFGRHRVVIEQEPGSGGKDAYAAVAKKLSGHDVRPDRVTGSKEERMVGFASQAGAGNVRCVDAAWTRTYLAELEKFPKGRFKDQADATSCAFAWLQLAGRAGAWGRSNR